MLDYRAQINEAKTLFALDVIERNVKRQVLSAHRDELLGLIDSRRFDLETADGHWLDVEPGAIA